MVTDIQYSIAIFQDPQASPACPYMKHPNLWNIWTEENQRSRRKTYSRRSLSTTDLTWSGSRSNPGLHQMKLANNPPESCHGLEKRNICATQKYSVHTTHKRQRNTNRTTILWMLYREIMAIQCDKYTNTRINWWENAVFDVKPGGTYTNH